MGRSSNSFSSYTRHAEETISSDRVTLPEKDLWVAVLYQAVFDACKGPIDYPRREARNFFVNGGYHFRLICEMAGRNPGYVQEKVKKVIDKNETNIRNILKS